VGASSYLGVGKGKSKEENTHYIVLAHLNEEEDISFLIKVLYYWEELNPTFSKNQPKTIEEYKKY